MRRSVSEKKQPSDTAEWKTSKDTARGRASPRNDGAHSAQTVNQQREGDDEGNDEGLREAAPALIGRTPR